MVVYEFNAIEPRQISSPWNHSSSFESSVVKLMFHGTVKKDDSWKEEKYNKWFQVDIQGGHEFSFQKEVP